VKRYESINFGQQVWPMKEDLTNGSFNLISYRPRLDKHDLIRFRFEVGSFSIRVDFDSVDGWSSKFFF